MSTVEVAGLLRELEEIEEITPRLFAILRELANDILAKAPSRSYILNHGPALLQLLHKLPTFFCQRLYDAYKRSPHRFTPQLVGETSSKSMLLGTEPPSNSHGGHGRNLYEASIGLIT